MTIYPDTSFLVPLYLSDQHTREAQQRMSGHPAVYLTPFHRAEINHAICLNVFRRNITPDEAKVALLNFEKDCDAGLWISCDLPESVFDICARLARSHAPTIGVRTLDSLHVATALELGATHFWTFDQRQARLAEAEGLITS